MNALPPARHHAGVALILVLCVLVLLTAVVVAFFTNATTDLTASKGYADETRVRLLSDSAVNVAEGQIRAATQGGTTGSPLAWASQPGMIRTYDTKGAAQQGYKLYSSDVPQLDLTAGPPDFTKEFPTDWNKRPSDFTDLNSPFVRAVAANDPAATVTDPNDPTKKYSARYPIVDGNNLVTIGNTGLLGYDMNSDGKADVEGFSVTPTATYSAGQLVGPNNNPVPMPVRWLYMLQDGRLQARDSTTGKISSASTSNPVVGRIAYWTDDDTCKLNINTASEGSAWDRPRAKTNAEVAYAMNIPVQNEFQMFPGHPAKNCLSTVFGSIWTIPGMLTTANYSQLKPYYDLTPRITEGQTYGSAGGTQPTYAAPNTGIPYDADRLYASVDELMFNSQISTANTPPTRETRSKTGATYTPITPQFLETTRFFLTASNRAPEVTLLNTPRISLWPLIANASDRTAKENLLAFCSTVPTGSNKLYAFQRLNAYSDGTFASGDSPTMDWDPSKPSGQRNNDLYKYLQTMVQADVPGLGGNFATKYGTATNQILTEMVDLLRSGVNTSLNVQPNYRYTREGQTMPLQPPAGSPGAGTRGFGRCCTVTEAAIDFFRCNDPKAGGPIQIGAVLILQNFCPSPGFSSLRPNVQIEVQGLDQFTICDSNKPTTTSVPLGMPSSATNVMDAIVGYTAYGNNTEYVGMETSFYYWNPNGIPPNNSPGNYLKTFAYAPPGAADTNYPFFNTPGTSQTQVGNGNLPSTATTFDFNGDAPTIPRNITVNIYSNPDPATIPRELIQTLQIPFPASFSLPVPVYAVGSPGDTSPAGSIFANRFANGGGDGQPEDPLSFFNVHNIIDRNDVVRSIVVDANGPSKGDLRVIAGLHSVPSSYFTRHPFYDYRARSTSPVSLFDPASRSAVDFNWRFAHSLKTGDNPGWGTIGWYNYSGIYNFNFLSLGSSGIARKSAFTGSLVAGLPAPLAGKVPPYNPEAFPAVPIGLTGAKLTGPDGNSYDGDWDTGQGALEDGPYINKPDETNTSLAFPIGIPNSQGQYADGHRDNSIYYNRSPANNESGRSYSPNREVASAVLFGSLPTGIDPVASSAASPTVKPWQTLLFCPYPSAGSGFVHPGFGKSSGTAPALSATPPAPPYSTVPDHYILDLFTMPIVEPYALSEPLSTQGKVNMNYQIAPFSYIRRDTAMRAVMKSVNMMAIPSTIQALTYYKSAAGSPNQYRYAINPDEGTGTLKAFEDRFSRGDIFRSASEICSVPLVPSQLLMDNSGNPQTYDTGVPSGSSLNYSSMQAFWDACKLTGDNVREEPYGDLYARLTTKSNTFTVHVRVQTLKKVLGTAPDTFTDPYDPTSGPKDLVTAEYRGAYQIERYVDPNVLTSGSTDPTRNFPDYATAGTTATPISTFYKFHTIGAKQF